MRRMLVPAFLPARVITRDAINYTLPKDNIAYILTAVTPAGDMDKYKPTFDAVVRSFKLKSE